MFTIEQIKAAHAQVKSGADFPNYIQALKKLGVQKYETFVIDGHTEFNGLGGFQLNSETKYAHLNINDVSNKSLFIEQLKKHQKGETTYPIFCSDCAENGIEKWIVDLQKMSCIYYDKSGNEILIEQVPEVKSIKK